MSAEWFEGRRARGCMEIVSLRDPSVGDSTASYVMVDGSFHCHQIEDIVREPFLSRPSGNWTALEKWVLEWKVPGKTAIPSGRYQVAITPSPKFKRPMIAILRVPGFSGIRAHGGLNPDHSEGCPLLGDELYHTPSGWRVRDGKSKPAVDRLFDLVHEALVGGEEVWWTFKPNLLRGSA